MARLFLSLYIFIALVLVILSTVLDPFFYAEDQIQSTESEMLRGLLKHVNRETLQVKRIAEASGFETQHLSVASMSWSDAEKQKLQNGEVISLYDPSLGHQFYLIDTPDQLLELTLRPKDQQSSSFLLYSAVFYALLGCLLVLWVWPLWRDLEKVKQQIGQLNNDGSISTISVAQRSLIRPVANAINGLSTQVSQLMLTQRELTGAVAHELRTPLSRLKFALAMKPAPTSSQWQAMHEDINELEKMVQEMLSFTSMEAHQPELSMSEIPLLALCKQITASPVEQQSQVMIKVSGEENYILADEHYLHRAIENLVLNALRHAESCVEVTLHSKDKHVFLFVDDDGAGIQPQWREKIFEPFFRPDESRDRKRGGAGLGLAIVKRIVQWHQGDCWAESSSLGGARFVITLPVGPDSQFSSKEEV